MINCEAGLNRITCESGEEGERRSPVPPSTVLDRAVRVLTVLSMKKLVAVGLLGLLLAGCEIGGDPSKSDSEEEASPPSREVEASPWPDLKDPQALSAVAAKAFEHSLDVFVKRPDGIVRMASGGSPFSGWIKVTRANGQLEWVWHLQDGKLHGPGAGWYPNGQMEFYGYFKDDQMDGLILSWYWNGHRSSDRIYRRDRLDAAMAWTPNGLECPLSRVKNGNGTLVYYHADGTIDRKIEFLNGLEVE